MKILASGGMDVLLTIAKCQHQEAVLHALTALANMTIDGITVSLPIVGL